MSHDLISPRAFQRLCALFRQASGICLSADKTALVVSRLRKRVDALGLPGFDEYCAYLDNAPHDGERQRAIDLLTTNETYFFREPGHFELLGKLLSKELSTRPLKVWSAACSTGEEPYSLAMTLHDRLLLGEWSVMATDLSTRALEVARTGVYPMHRLDNLPAPYLKRYFLRGVGEYEGSIRVSDELRKRVDFSQHNLLDELLGTQSFDVIFLRNVLIYFEQPRKLEIVTRLVRKLRVGGCLFLGHAEPLNGSVPQLRRLSNSVYQRISTHG